MPTITTTQVFDFETLTGDPTQVNPPNAVGSLITATLNFNQVNAVSPQSNLQTMRISTVTDTTGRWQLNLIPNTNINPANTLWTITTPTKNYQINVPATGPVQSTSILATQPSTLAGAGGTVTGPLTVTGLLTAQAGETVAGGLTVSSGGATITAGGLAVQAGGATIAGGETVSGGVLNAQAGLTVAGGATIAGALRRSAQSIAYAASITPDPTLGEVVSVGTLIGNITVNNPINALAGQVLTFIFVQDATGNRTVTWGAAFNTSWQLVAGFGSVTQTVSFIYDGTSWQTISGPSVDSALHMRAVTLALGSNLSAGTTSLGATTVSRLLGSGATPTLGALQTNVTAQSFVAGSTDTRGGVTVTTNATGVAAGNPLAVVTFAAAYASTPFIFVTAAFSATSTYGGMQVLNPSATGFTIANGSTAQTNGNFTINYWVIG